MKFHIELKECSEKILISVSFEKFVFKVSNWLFHELTVACIWTFVNKSLSDLLDDS